MLIVVFVVDLVSKSSSEIQEGRNDDVVREEERSESLANVPRGPAEANGARCVQRGTAMTRRRWSSFVRVKVHYRHNFTGFDVSVSF